MRKLLLLSLALNAMFLAHWSWRRLAAEAQGAGGDLVPRCALTNGDVNGDGDLDISDAVYLLSWLFGGGTEPVPMCAPGQVQLSVENLLAVANCMPIVKPDPWRVTWDLQATNSLGRSVAIAIDSAELAFGDPAAPAFRAILTATPQAVEVGAGAVTRFSFEKSELAPAPGCQMCGKSVELKVICRIDGIVQPALSLSATAQCAF